jgi:uncharacterized protein (TIGR02391 family)
MLITSTQADELLSTLSSLSGLDPRLAEKCTGLIRSERYDEAVSRAFVVLEERLRDTLGVRGGAGVNLAEKAFAHESGELADRLMLARAEVNGIRNLFVGAFKAYRNRAAHTIAGYSLDEARAIVHLVNLLLLVLEQVRSSPAHSVREDVAQLLAPQALGRLRSFLEALDGIGIRKATGVGSTAYKASLQYHPPSWDAPRPYPVTVLYVHAVGGKPVVSFRTSSLRQVVGVDVDSLERDLLQLGCERAAAKTTPVRLDLDRHNDQSVFDRVFDQLRGMMEQHRVSHVPRAPRPAGPRKGAMQAELGQVGAGTKRVPTESDSLLMEFWAQLLHQANQRTDLHARNTPAGGAILTAASGARHILYLYRIRMHDAEAGLLIQRETLEETKRAFDRLSRSKDVIEERFGGSLVWLRQDDVLVSYIKAMVKSGGLRDRDRWPEIHEEMVDAMVRFEKAIAPELARLD